jgi:hypothetical protein
LTLFSNCALIGNLVGHMFSARRCAIAVGWKTDSRRFPAALEREAAGISCCESKNMLPMEPA